MLAVLQTTVNKGSQQKIFLSDCNILKTLVSKRLSNNLEKMNKYKITIIILLFTALCVNVPGQTKKYSFEVQKIGKGKQAIIFIMGFACSVGVWNRTITKF